MNHTDASRSLPSCPPPTHSSTQWSVTSVLHRVQPPTFSRPTPWVWVGYPPETLPHYDTVQDPRPWSPPTRPEPRPYSDRPRGSTIISQRIGDHILGPDVVFRNPVTEPEEYETRNVLPFDSVCLQSIESRGSVPSLFSSNLCRRIKSQGRGIGDGRGRCDTDVSRHTTPRTDHTLTVGPTLRRLPLGTPEENGPSTGATTGVRGEPGGHRVPSNSPVEGPYVPSRLETAARTILYRPAITGRVGLRSDTSTPSLESLRLTGSGQRSTPVRL